MVVHIVNTKNYMLNKSDSNIHTISFKISADSDAPVSKYFTTTFKLEEDKTLKASFRGYPLRGQKIPLPEGYLGFVVHESIAPVSETQERKFHVINKFNSITYWNWDKHPSKNDMIVKALEWIDVAEALHSPIEN